MNFRLRYTISNYEMKKPAGVKINGIEKGWQHPGGKFREKGGASLTDNELIAILISTGIKGKTAGQIADEIIDKYGSLQGLMNQPLANRIRF